MFKWIKRKFKVEVPPGEAALVTNGKDCKLIINAQKPLSLQVIRLILFSKNTLVDKDQKEKIQRILNSYSIQVIENGE